MRVTKRAAVIAAAVTAAAVFGGVGVASAAQIGPPSPTGMTTSTMADNEFSTGPDADKIRQGDPIGPDTAAQVLTDTPLATLLYPFT